MLGRTQELQQEKNEENQLNHNSMKQEGDYKMNKTEVQAQSGQDGHLNSFPYFYTFTWKYVEMFFHILKFTFKTLLHLWWEINQEKTQPQKKSPKTPSLNTPITRLHTSLCRNPNNLPLISMFCN